MTLLEAKQHLARKLNIEYSDIANNDLFSDTDLGVLIQLAVQKAWDYKPWDFTEGAKTATTISDMASSGYADYPQDFQSGSIFLLTVGGKEFKKLLFQDYRKYLEDYPDAEDRFWSEYKRFIFINANAYTVGDALCLFGKLMPPILTQSTDLLPFSPDTDNQEHSGNEAIIQLAYGEALSSDKLKDSARGEIERGNGYQILNILWKPMADARSLLQSKNRPFFNTPDFFGPGSQATNQGKFTYLN